MQPIQFFAARHDDGALLPNATIDVYLKGTQTRATLYADDSETPLGNPAYADAGARVFLYTPAERVDIQISKGGYVAPLMRDILVVDVTETLAEMQDLADQVADSVVDAAASAEAAAAGGEVYASTADALSNGVYSLDSLVAGSGGTNGTFALAFSGGAGSGAAGWFTVAGGAISAYEITARGRGYTSAPAISFAASSGLSGASATAVIAPNRDVGQPFLLRSADDDLFREEYIVEAGPVATATNKSLPSVVAVDAVNARITSLYPSYEVELCGYAQATIDDTYVIVSSINENGVKFGAANYDAVADQVAALAPMLDYEVELCGYKFAQCDDDYIILSAVDEGGSEYPDISESISAYAENALDRAYRLASSDTVFLQAKSSFMLRSINAQPNVKTLTANDDSIIWSSDNDAAVGGLWHTISANENTDVYPVLPLPSKFCVVGDSLTAGSGASSIPLRWRSLLATSLGKTVILAGHGGQTSPEIAAKIDAVPALLTVASNQIPASGAVTVTAWDTSPITNQGPGPYNGWLAGVYGSLAAVGYDGGGRPTSMTFTRSTAGSIVSCPAGTAFRVDVGDGDRVLTTLWMGRNNNSQTAQIISDYAACFERNRNVVKYVLVIGNVNGAGGGIGTSEYTNMNTVNDALAAAYGDAYLDIHRILVDAYNPGDAQDVADYADDIVPTSLRADGTHHNDAGQQIIHDAIIEKLTNLGWI